MKKTAKLSLLIAPFLGLSMISCGDNFDAPQDAGPVCYYNGVRYTVGQTWKAKDGCNVCTCGFDSKMLCGPDSTCRDGGQPGFDALPSADASLDRRPLSDVVSLGDAGADQARDAASLDIPVRSDGPIVDAAEDGSTSDSRPDSKRD